MTNRQSYLDSMNAGRRRRPSTSLEQLSDTLDELESRIGRTRPERSAERAGERSGMSALRGRAQRLSSATSYYEPYDAPAREQTPDRYAAPRRDSRAERREAPDRSMASELHALREELRQQMSTGLREEFSKLKDDIQHAVRTSAPASYVAELGVEFERLAAMIHKMSGKSDDRQITLLRLEMEELKSALGKLAREDTVRAFDRRWDELDQRWNDIASHMQQDRRDPAGDAALDALSARLEQINDAVKALPTSVSLLALEDEMRALTGTVDRIAHRQDRIAPETLATIEDRLDEISRAIALSAAAAAGPSPALQMEPFERIESRISLLARQLGEVADDRAAEDRATHGLADQMEVLARRVEDIAHRVDLPGATIDRLSSQIELIARKLDQTPQAGDIDDVFRGIEDRFVSLSAMLERRQEDALAQGHSLFRDLERRLEDVSERMDARSSAPSQDSHLLDAMDARFAELASRIDQQFSAPDDRVIRDFGARLDEISSRIDATPAQPGVDPALIHSLEAQIAGLTAHIAQPPQPAETSHLLPRLDQIEKTIAAGRTDVMEAARHAAEEAVRSFTPGTGEGLLVAGLVEDLKSLETLTRKSDDRNAKTFEAIHDTLLKIVDRLGSVELLATSSRERAFGLKDTPSIAPDDDVVALDAIGAVTLMDIAAEHSEKTDEAVAGAKRFGMLGGLTRALSGRKGAAKTAAPVVPPVEEADVAPTRIEAPAIDPDERLDPSIANRPLEPGSGAPDLNAIMRRVRDERAQSGRGGSDADAAKADFIAAARRAAQAAAAEAEVMKHTDEPAKKGGSGSLLSVLKGRRKPVLMGVAAVLLALAALQYGQGLLGAGKIELAETVVPDAVEMPEASTGPLMAQAMPETAALDVTPPARVIEGDLARDALPVTAPESENTDWLNVETAKPLAPEAPAAEPELTEIETVPVATPAMVAEIPLEAGPAALREAAAEGDPKALFEIGNRYADGRGVKADMAQAATWYAKAAEEGLAPAQYRIANMYEKGNGLARDLIQAKTWYQLAAEQGNAGAMHNLAVLFAMGADGTTDNESAARWFGKASEFGVIDSQFNLAILSAKGVGLPQNLEEAYKWFALVAKSGDKDAAEKRDEVANALRPEQLDTARAAVELWRAKAPSPEANDVEIPESWGEDNAATASVDMTQAVRNIQHILNKNGYSAGSADGMMGQKTKSAIAAFQKDNGMTATGEVDEKLVRALLERR